jgi:oligopeptide/dipeptide ABC transporter ATP-binding protein
MNALNPVFSIRQQLTEAFLLHRPDATPADAAARISWLFEMVDIPAARLSAYPHELSGGMLQRVMIALALLHGPALLIADEPTTALDVLTQGQILAEIAALRRRLNLALILITHDMGVVAETCDRIAVMYAGEIVEIAPTATIFGNPRHPYTRALIGASPSLFGPKRRLATIPGDAFVATDARDACRFAPRCPRVAARCRVEAPRATALTADHLAACHFAAEDIRAGTESLTA